MMLQIQQLLSRFKKQPEPEPEPEPVGDIVNIETFKETFNPQNIYKARWVWYHTIMAFELFLIIILLIGILIKV